MIMQVEHLTKSFGGRTLFSDACFRLEAHDRLALVGPNGAGKTTMLKIITGHEDADSGNVVFAKGAVVSPCSDSVDAQLMKMERKVKAGAEFFQTQAVFEPEKFIKFMEQAKQFGKPVQVGIIIPKSAGMCKFMNKNVAGVHIPDALIEELQADKEKTKAGITGVEIAARIIRECKPYCQGVHIMSLGWESKIPALLEQAGLK